MQVKIYKTNPETKKKQKQKTKKNGCKTRTTEN